MADTTLSTTGAPRSVGKYRIEKLIGSGGMGTVYLATDIFLRRSVALKVLSPLSESFQDALERFFREARAVARLEHPNIVRIYDADDNPASPFIAMELVKGIDADELIRRHPPLSTALSVAAQVFEGLGHAHDLGVVHRDVKPTNVLIAEDGTVKLIDFGLARLHDDERDLTRGKVFGSAAYMAPEQITDPRGIDFRADIYAAGALLCQLVTGQVPYQGATLAETLVQVVHGPLPPLRERAPGCPEEVMDVILACLAKARDDRPASAREVALRLRAVAARISEPHRFGGTWGAPAGPPPLPVARTSVPQPAPAADLPAPVNRSAPPAQDSAPDDELSAYDIGEEPDEGPLEAPVPPPERPLATRRSRLPIAAIAAAGAAAAILLAVLVFRSRAGEDAPSAAEPATIPPLVLGGASIPPAAPGGVSGQRTSDVSPRLVPVAPAPGTMRLSLGRGQTYEFRVTLDGAGAGAAAPGWRLDDEPVGTGDRYLYRAPLARGRQLVTVSWGDGSDRAPVTLLWYVDVE